MISSGRSFTFLLVPLDSLPGDELVAEALEAAAHAGVHAQRASLQDHAADQLGVDFASGLDRAAGGLLDLLTIEAASSSDSSYAVVSSTATRPCARSTSAWNSSRISGNLARAALRPRARAGSCGRARRHPRTARRARSTSPRLDLGVGEESRELGRRLDRVGELGEVTLHCLDAALASGGLEEGARIQALGNCHGRLASPPLERGEVEPLDRLVDQATLVGRVEHLADDPLGRLEREIRDLAADLVDRARRSRPRSACACPRGGAAARPPPRPSPAGSGRRRPSGPRRGSGPTPTAPRRGWRGSARAAPAPRCGRCPPPRRPRGCGRGAPRSSSGSARRRTS